MSIRNAFLFTLLLTIALFTIACQSHNHPVATHLPPSDSLTSSTFHPSLFIPKIPPAPCSAPHFGVRPNFAPNAFGDNLALSVRRNFANDENHFPEMTDGLLSTYWATLDTIQRRQYQFVGLVWDNPVKLSRLFFINQQFPQFAQSVVSVTYRNAQTGNFEYLPGFPYEEVQLPPEYSGWYPTFWFRDYFTFGGSATSSCDIIFPEIETNYLIVFIIPNSQTGENGNPSFQLYLSEFEAYGPAKPLKISSPANNSLFVSGENIHFTSSANMNLINYYWTANGVALGTSPGSPNTSANYLAPGTHTIQVTAQKASDLSQVSDSITIGVQDIAEIKIKNLDAPSAVDPFGVNFAVSYRAATTRFQAIGFRSDGTEIGPVAVDWELVGGDVNVPSQQLRSGILSHLGQPNTKIGNFRTVEDSPLGSIFPVEDASGVTFQSFLPGNISIKATKGSLSDSVAIRIKQPTFKVAVHPVGDVDTSILPTWESVLREIWEKENIIRVESVELTAPIPNVTYPNPPLTPAAQGAEEFQQSKFGESSLLAPLVYDFLLGDTSGFFNVPRQSGLLLSFRIEGSANVFLVDEPLSYYVSNPSSTPPTTSWYFPDIYPISSRDNFVVLEVSGIFIRTPTSPFYVQQERFLAAGIGRLFGLPQYAEWLENFMDFSPVGGYSATPIQFISALNYQNDNPQNSILIWEE